MIVIALSVPSGAAAKNTTANNKMNFISLKKRKKESKHEEHKDVAIPLIW